MRHAVVVSLVGMLAFGPAGVARAQSDPVIGRWSGVSFGADGTRRFAMTLEIDDTFVSVLSLPNGLTQRVWGKYRSTRVTPTEMTISFTTQGWLPYQTCVRGAGVIPRCTPYKPILATPITLTFPSPVSSRVGATTFKVDDATWVRESSMPALMSRIVPDHVMLPSPASAAGFGLPAPRKYGLPP
jgi:hypothetical protein